MVVLAKDRKEPTSDMERGKTIIQLMISIIIPTLNEEKYLPLLLASIKDQDFKDYEIILADAGSKDRTLEIARKYNCLIIPGGLPSKGRNEGAKAAKGDLLFFIDADSILSADFFEKCLNEFRERNLDFASFGLMPIEGKKIHKLAFNMFYNWYIYAVEKILPHAAMGILAKRDLFLRLNGYDETIKLAEDHDLGRRAHKIATFGIIKSVKINVSDRRFRKDGWIKTIVKYVLCELHMIFIGPVRSDIFKYEFGHYKDKTKN
jgi:glycosyltransferase involved in cell wall biosynthesis